MRSGPGSRLLVLRGCAPPAHEGLLGLRDCRPIAPVPQRPTCFQLGLNCNQRNFGAVGRPALRTSLGRNLQMSEVRRVISSLGTFVSLLPCLAAFRRQWATTSRSEAFLGAKF